MSGLTHCPNFFSVSLFSSGRGDGCYGKKEFWVSKLFRLSLERLFCLKNVAVKLSKHTRTKNKCRLEQHHKQDQNASIDSNFKSVWVKYSWDGNSGESGVLVNERC